jgi:glycosyltransferase involved in cell wall biosynthesis
MIRVALDRSAALNAAARTGIARYVVELSAALRLHPEAVLLDDERFSLWRGLSDWKQAGIAAVARGFIREYLWLPSQLRKGEIDVYHATVSRAPARRVPVPMVITVHDFAAYEFPDMQGKRRGAQLRRQVRKAVEEAALIIVASASVRDELTLRFPNAAGKVRVVHHGIGQLFNRPRCTTSASTFVSVATMERRKNLTTLIDAFAIVVGRRPEARLRLIGQPHNDTAMVHERLKRLGLDSVVSVEGYLTDDDVAAAYAGATATVYPSLYEGFGMPVTESMAAGAPVIAADIAVIREVAGEAALFVDPLDADAMATAMLRLMEDHSLNAALSAAGRARAAAFTWERSAREHIGVYLEAAKL